MRLNDKARKDQFDDVLKQAGKKLGTSPDKLQDLKNKKPEELMKKLRPEEAAKLNQIMNNPELTQQLLNTPQAKMLMKRLMGDK